MLLERSLRVLIISLAVLVFFQGIPLGTNASPLATPQVTSQPDLNLLLERVTQFWSLLKEGRKEDALQHVDPVSRESFLKRQDGRILSFAIRNIQLGVDDREALVTVEAKIPAMGAPVRVPINEWYVFREDTWWVSVDGSRASELFGASEGGEDHSAAKGASRGSAEDMLLEFTLKAETFDLGEMGQLDNTSRRIVYHNGGYESVFVTITHAPEWVSFDKDNFWAPPGKTGVVKVSVSPAGLEGDISDVIEVLLTYGRAELEHRFPLTGYVRNPVIVTPDHLAIDGSASSEVSIRNNSNHQIWVRRVIPPEYFLTTEWMGEGGKGRIEPGETRKLRVSWKLDEIPDDWTSDSMRLLLDQPLEDDGRDVLKIPLIREQE